MAREYRRWTAEEDARLLQLHAEGKFFRQIDVILKRPDGGSGDRHKLLIRGQCAPPTKPTIRPSRTLLRDVIRAHEADRIKAGHTSVTAMLLGDPLPGQSALDKIPRARLAELGGAP